MSEYIHSGVAGKINRITKPHIGNILVTSEYGNAKESTLTEDILKAAVNDINRIKYAVTYKGEKATVDALPTTGNTKGDMWNVTENGHNYAWNGSTWDDLGGENNTNVSNYELTSVSNVFPSIPSMTQPGLKLSDNNGNDSFVTITSTAQLNLGGTFIPELTITQSTVGLGPGMPTVPAIIINLSGELSASLNTMKSDIELLKSKVNLN